MSLLTTPLYCILHGRPIAEFPPDCPAASDDPGKALEGLHGEAYRYFSREGMDAEAHLGLLHKWRACTRCSAIEVKHGS